MNQTKIQYLGFEISSDGIKPAKERVQNLRELPTPTDKKIVQRYIGMFGFYQRFIPRFAEITKPMRDSMRKPKFEWNKDAEKSLNTLKEMLVKTTELCFPIKDGVFLITTDASCLHQLQKVDAAHLMKL